MTDRELKPCPFCGGEARDGKDGEYFLVRCTHCGAEQFSDIRRVAVSSWNRRAYLPPTPAEAMRCPEVVALVKAMRGMCDVWHSTCVASGWDPFHVSQYETAITALEQEARHE